jgi:hypothetical protein
MPDGGWNCQYPGATHASMNTTISALEGLAEWQTQFGEAPEVSAARRRGEGFLLDHRLFRSHRTGNIIDSRWRRFWWPGSWHYDVLRALEYVRASSEPFASASHGASTAHHPSGAPPDARLADAIALVESKRDDHGRWPLDVRYPGPMPVDLAETEGHPSRWLTLRALRVLRWYSRA